MMPSEVRVLIVDRVKPARKSTRSTFYLFAFAALWAGTLLSLGRWQHFETSEAVIAFVVLAVILPALAMLATRGITPLDNVVRRPRVETSALMLYLAVIAWVLVYGFGYFVDIGAEPWHSILILAAKLLIFVLIPGSMIWLLGGYSFSDQTLIAVRGRALRPAFWMSLAALIMQLLLGEGLQTIRAAHLPLWVIFVASPLSFVWFTIEVGLAEEFFFRVLLAGAARGRAAIAVGRPGCRRGSLRVGTCTGVLLAFRVHSGRTRPTSISYDGCGIFDRHDLASRSVSWCFMDSDQESCRIDDCSCPYRFPA
jgi:hypothetical protein